MTNPNIGNLNYLTDRYILNAIEHYFKSGKTTTIRLQDNFNHQPQRGIYAPFYSLGYIQGGNIGFSMRTIKAIGDGFNEKTIPLNYPYLTHSDVLWVWNELTKRGIAKQMIETYPPNNDDFWYYA